ncbi:MAG: DUF7093 family protein, partial [Halanaeroarchaeum sp.]
MGIRCSMFGHAFGEPEVEREREERGSEVVTVEREVEICQRCGERNVISENTEVTAADSAPDDGTVSDADVEEEQPTTSESDGDAVPTDAAVDEGAETSAETDADEPAEADGAVDRDPDEDEGVE